MTRGKNIIIFSTPWTRFLRIQAVPAVYNEISRVGRTVESISHGSQADMLRWESSLLDGTQPATHNSMRTWKTQKRKDGRTVGAGGRPGTRTHVPALQPLRDQWRPGTNSPTPYPLVTIPFPFLRTTFHAQHANWRGRRLRRWGQKNKTQKK